MKFGFSSNSSFDGLDILHGGNVFGHATLRNNFLMLDLDDSHNNSSSVFFSYFNSKFESF